MGKRSLSRSSSFGPFIQGERVSSRDDRPGTVVRFPGDNTYFDDGDTDSVIEEKKKQMYRRGLKKELSLIPAIALICGTMIGSGIFSSPRTIYRNAGSVGMGLTVWVGCGVLSLFGSICYIELGTMIPLSGGEYTYLHKGFGPAMAFLFSWTSVLVAKPASLAGIAYAFAEYTLNPFFPNCVFGSREDLVVVVKLFAALCIGRCLMLDDGWYEVAEGTLFKYGP